MVVVFTRAVILYLFIVLILRLMGKKQIGQLQPSELVVALVIADLGSTPMSNIGIPLINGIIPILTLFVIEKLLSFITLKSEKARGIICGMPSILIEKGVILEKEMQRLCFNINDLLEELRIKSIFDVKNVEYAILETNGQLSVIPKSDARPLTPKDVNLSATTEVLPVTVIVDGRTNTNNLHIIGLDENWLKNELTKNDIQHIKDVFFAYITSDSAPDAIPYRKLNYQLKSKKKGTQ